MVQKKRVIIIGCGFAGLGCAKKLVEHDNVHITLIDKNNYHQFQPLLYQLATSALGSDQIATSIRELVKNRPNADFKMAEVTSIDPHTLTVTTKTGEKYQGDFLVLATGSEVQFFGTPGAAQYAFRCCRYAARPGQAADNRRPSPRLRPPPSCRALPLLCGRRLLVLRL